MEKQFKDNLRRLRIENRFTQKQIAEQLSVSETCYAHWEQGRSEPNIATLKELCRILNVGIAELLCME